MKKKKVPKNIIYPISAVCFLLVLWYIVAKIKNNSLVLPTPYEVLIRFGSLFVEKNFWKSVGMSVLRTYICFSISFLSALVLSFIKPLHGFLMPVISLLRSAPTVAVILVFYAFMSTKILAIIVGFLIAFPILYSSFYSANEQVDNSLLEMATVYNIPKIKQIFGIILPQSVPIMVDACRSTLSLTLKVIIASEILTLLSDSIGGEIQSSYASFEISYLLAWTLVAVMLGYLMELSVTLLKKAIIRWK